MKSHHQTCKSSILQAKEAELQLVNKLLEDSELTALKYRQWKQHNEDLHLDIEKFAAERTDEVEPSHDRATPGGESNTSRLYLSDGEQLVDAETPSGAGHSLAPSEVYI